MHPLHKYRGLSESEVDKSRSLHGNNVVTPKEKGSAWKLLFSKFQDPIIRILLTLLIVSFGISFYEMAASDKGVEVLFEPLGILIAISLAIGVAFVFEFKAMREFNLLSTVSDDQEIKVVRSGQITQVARRDLVVGDIVLLDQGEEVPADGVLLASTHLLINESSLTGEPIVEKSHRKDQEDVEATYPTNMLMRGSTVSEGNGTIEITAVGDKTDYGKVFHASTIDTGTKTPLNKQLESLSKLITKISYILAATIIVARLLFYFLAAADMSWLGFIHAFIASLLLALTLVVVSVPEGLPMSVTLSLAMSMRRMFRSGSLVRKLHATETMGATSVICTDKTGTLTLNKMVVAESLIRPLLPDTASTSDVLAENIAVNSTAHLDMSDSSNIHPIGNPTEGALLMYLQQHYAKGGIDVEPYYLKIRSGSTILAQRPFSNEYKYMSTIVPSQLFAGKRVLYVKGAPEIILRLSDPFKEGLTNQDIEEALRGYQSQAMRSLGFAYRILPEDEELSERSLLANTSPLTFIGIVGIEDPIREEVTEAVDTCLKAGIKVKMVTGDTLGTAREIAKRVGLWDEAKGDSQIIEGPTFEKLSDDDLLARIDQIKIMARAKPLDKSRLVKMLVDEGEIVAVTGDGTNDAPAMNVAHIGLSMGDGTSAAKEASDITILNNSFSTITNAVLWGRSVYLNIRRFILFQLTINVAACAIVLFGALLGTDSPLTITQMLWVNIIMDSFAAMALASLPPEASLMKYSPRKRDQFIISRAMLRQVISVGLVFVVVLLFFFQYLNYYDVQSISDIRLSDSLFAISNFRLQTGGITRYESGLFFTFFVMLQFWNLFNARALRSGHSALHSLHKSRGFLLISLAIILGQLLIVSFGGELFNVEPLSLKDWFWIVALSSFVLWIGELLRFLKKMRNT